MTAWRSCLVVACRESTTAKKRSVGSRSRHHDALLALRANHGLTRGAVDGCNLKTVVADQLHDERRKAVFHRDEQHRAARSGECHIEEAPFFGMGMVVAVRHRQQHDGIVLTG